MLFGLQLFDRLEGTRLAWIRKDLKDAITP